MSWILDSMSESRLRAAHSAASWNIFMAAYSSALRLPSAMRDMNLALAQGGQSSRCRQEVSAQQIERTSHTRVRAHRAVAASGAPCARAAATKGSNPMGGFFSRANASSPSQSFSRASVRT